MQLTPRLRTTGLAVLGILVVPGIVILRSESDGDGCTTTSPEGKESLHFPASTPYEDRLEYEGGECVFAIHEEYDEYKDRTVTVVALTRFGIGLSSPEESCGFLFPGLLVTAVRAGKNLSVPPQEVQWFFIESRTSSFGDAEFDCLLDGKGMHFGSLPSTPGDGGTAWSCATMPTASFLAIVNATEFRGRFGTREFRFSDNEIAALRDYASRLAPR